MDVTHTFTSYACFCDLYTTTVTYNTFKTYFFIFTTSTFPVLSWTYEGIIETWFAQYQESNNVIIHDIEECKKTSEAIYERLKPQGVNTLVTGPIKINGKIVGFYGVDNPPEEKLHEISNEIDMIEFMIEFMIRLRDNADALEHSALYDQLTDCKNRKALDWAYTEKL